MHSIYKQGELPYLNVKMCPKCGNKLILKNSKYGTFVGCSNFPKCRYIKKDN